MKKIIYSICLLLSPCFLHGLVMGQQPEDLVFKVQTIIQESPPSISFTWDAVPGDSVITICRKDPEAADWGEPIAVLAPDATSFTDNDVETGVEYEYRIQKRTAISYLYWVIANCTSYEQWQEEYRNNPKTDYKPIITYLSAGIKLPEVEYRGKVILLVDSSFVDSLHNELKLFETDLLGDGWEVLRKDISRNTSVKYVKSVVRDFYYSDTVDVKSLILFGHIPVPYSGCAAVDQHQGDVGAWQADQYYGSMKEEIWTDEAVNCTIASREVNKNVPGDGKFDLSVLPPDENIVLQIGRIDLSKMPAFKVSEAELLKNYILKNHNFRHKINNPKVQALICDNLGFGTSGEYFGSSNATGSIRNFTALVTKPNINIQEEVDFFAYGNRDSYLFSYVCGAGGEQGTSITGATTASFIKYRVKTIFTSLFGSWVGNWDIPNNLLRASLASEGWSLTCIYDAFPYHTYHMMGMGNSIGYGVCKTQNNIDTYDFNSDNRGMHVFLLGDPTLRMHIVCPVNSLQSAITSDNTIMLAWKPADDSIIGYHVYKLDTLSNGYNRITTDPVTDTWFEDVSPDPGKNYYMVKTYALTESASGSYYNLSQGVFDTINYKVKPAVPVDSIELYLASSNLLPLMIYDPVKVNALVYPDSATNKLLHWSVINGTANGKFDVTGDILADKGGWLSIIAEALDGSGTADSLKIFIDSIPDAAGPITGAAEACRDSKNRMYTVSEIRGAKYFLWNYPNGKNDTTVLNESNYAINNTAVSGTIYVSGLNPFGTGESSSLDITVYDIPPAPEITLEGNTLHSDAPEGNQWYRNDTLIEGATGQEYVAVDSGRYCARVTVNGCTSANSNKIIYDPTGIEQNDKAPLVTIYPNPVTNQLFVDFAQPVTSNTSLKLMDITGKVVNAKVLDPGESTTCTIDLSALAEGVYFIKISNREFTLTEKVVKY